MNDERNEIQSYYWHLSNIFENRRDEILYNKDPEDVIIQLKPLGEYDSEYMEIHHNILKKDEFELFKSSKIYNDYYNETNYRLDNLKNDIDLDKIMQDISHELGSDSYTEFKINKFLKKNFSLI